MTLKLHGYRLIGDTLATSGDSSYRSVNPVTGEELGTPFFDASPQEVDKAMLLATETFPPYLALDAATRVKFLEAIADEIDALGTQLIETAHAETGYPISRCESERSRATSQARLFAELLREGSWVDARIDLAIHSRQPLPKPDIRSLLRPVGPVVVFGASNFPIAISVVEADTISALAAGYPVIVKVHPAHSATCELAARALLSAAKTSGIPPGVFSLIHGRDFQVGLPLVQHSAQAPLPEKSEAASLPASKCAPQCTTADHSPPRPIAIFHQSEHDASTASSAPFAIENGPMMHFHWNCKTAILVGSGDSLTMNLLEKIARTIHSHNARA